MESESKNIPAHMQYSIAKSDRAVSPAGKRQDMAKDYLRKDRELQKFVDRIRISKSPWPKKVKYYVLYKLTGEPYKVDINEVYDNISRGLESAADRLLGMREEFKSQNEQLMRYYAEGLNIQGESKRQYRHAQAERRALLDEEAMLDSAIEDGDDDYDRVVQQKIRLMHARERRHQCEKAMIISSLRYNWKLAEESMIKQVRHVGYAIDAWGEHRENSARLVCEHIDNLMPMINVIRKYILQGIETEAEMLKVTGYYNTFIKRVSELMQYPMRYAESSNKAALLSESAGRSQTEAARRASEGLEKLLNSSEME